jgi:uncharacterized protein YjbJ (UPF0337 family)
MNADILKGRWKEIKGDIKRRWGKLTDDDLVEVEGMEDMLLGLLQKNYGYAREEAEKEYGDFMKSLDNPAAMAEKEREMAKKEKERP